MKDFPETSRVIVYGSLKRGGFLSSYLRNSKYIGVRDVTGVEVYCNGTFPYACFAPGVKVYENTRKFIPNPDSDKRLIGEVYEVTADTLYRLDCAESEGRHYHRVQVEIDGEWTYIYIVDRESAAQYEFVPSGWWSAPEYHEPPCAYRYDAQYIEGVLDYYKDKLDDLVMPENRQDAHDILDDIADTFELWEV